MKKKIGRKFDSYLKAKPKFKNILKKEKVTLKLNIDRGSGKI